MGYYSAIKTMKYWPFTATWMDLETVILSEVRQISHCLYVESEKMVQMNLFTKKQVTNAENKLKVTGGRARREGLIGRLGLTYTHYYI